MVIGNHSSFGIIVVFLCFWGSGAAEEQFKGEL